MIPLVAVIFPKFIIDELMGEQRGSYLFVFTIILIGVNMFGNMLAAFFRGRSLICKGEVFNKFQIMVAEKLADCDFERLESSEFLDTKERAKKFIFANGHDSRRFRQRREYNWKNICICWTHSDYRYV